MWYRATEVNFLLKIYVTYKDEQFSIVLFGASIVT